MQIIIIKYSGITIRTNDVSLRVRYMCVCHVEIMMIMMMINFVTRQVIPSKQLCDVRSLSRWKLHGLALINTHTHTVGLSHLYTLRQPGEVVHCETSTYHQRLDRRTQRNFLCLLIIYFFL